MSFLKRMMSIPVVRYGLLTLGSGVWVLGLIDQIYSSAAPIKYLAISALIGVVALL